MTREEAKEKMFKQWQEFLENNIDYAGISEAYKMAISALEQEPKTGHWIKIKPYPLQMHDYECSECGHETDDDTEDYCSSCGARMVEPQESEG